MNCRGLNGAEKRRDVIKFLRDSEGDIFCLQDIHIQESQQVYFKTLWGGQVVFSSFFNDKRGVCIMFKPHLDVSVIDTIRDTDGNLLIVKCVLSGKTVVISNVYGPNEDTPNFYTHLGSILDEFTDEDVLMICGDMNLVMDYGIDTYNYTREHNRNARRALNNVLEKQNLVDVWREMHPNTPGYTWTRPEPFRQSRLDMFFIGNDSLHLVKSCEICPGYRTDHDRVVIHLALSQDQRGPGTWKFNAGLLKDETYVFLIKKCILKTTKEYAVPIYSDSFFMSENAGQQVQLVISASLFFDVLLMKLRETSVFYGRKKAKSSRESERAILDELSKTKKRLNESNDPGLIELVVSLDEKLESIRKEKIHGLMVRSKANWQHEGEKPSKFFLSLEKSAASRKTIPWLNVAGNRVEG